MKMKFIKYIIIPLITSTVISGCVSVPKESVELSDITGKQTAELQKSHIRFVQLYYSKLRDDVNEFITTKWIPVFLSKIVENEEFRADLDNAYITSNIQPEDLTIEWKGKPVKEPQKEAVLSGVKKSITDEKAKLGQVLLDFSEGAQVQINKIREDLLDPIDAQEKFVINEINAAYADLQNGQAAIKGYLASAVKLQEKQDETLKKLGVLEKSQKIINKAVSASESLGELMEKKDDVDSILKQFKNMLSTTQDDIETAAEE